jgi:hypothetical protein
VKGMGPGPARAAPVMLWMSSSAHASWRASSGVWPRRAQRGRGRFLQVEERNDYLSGKASGLPRRPPLSTARAAFTASQRKQAPVDGAGLQAVRLRWRARSSRWQAAWTRRVWSPSGELGRPWWVR